MIVDELVTLLKFDIKGGEKAEKFKESLEAMTDGAKKVVLGIGGMITAVAAFADKVSRELTENYRWAKSLGVAADSYQRFDYAAKLIGGSLDSIKGDLESWVRSAQASGQTLEQVFLKEAASVEGMTAAQSHAFLSARGYSEDAIRLLQQGQTELSRTLAQAEVIPEEQLQAAEDYVKTWELFSSEIKQVMYGAVAQALPALKEILQNIKEFLFQNKDSVRHFIIAFFTASANMAKMLYRSLRPFLEILANAVKWLNKLTSGGKDTNKTVKLLEYGIKALLAAFALSTIINFVNWIGTLGTSLWTIVTTIGTFIATAGPILLVVGLIAAAAYSIYTLTQNFEGWAETWESIKVAFQQPALFFEALTEQINNVIEKFEFLVKMRDALGDFFYWAGKKLGVFEDYGDELEAEMSRHPEFINNLTSLGTEKGLNSVSTNGTTVVPSTSTQNNRSYNDNRNITINTNATSGPAIASYLQNNDLVRGGYGVAGAY